MAVVVAVDIAIVGTSMLPGATLLRWKLALSTLRGSQRFQLLGSLSEPSFGTAFSAPSSCEWRVRPLREPLPARRVSVA
ncbi:hypothetical protein BOSEA31B_11223 [Hyphomicrobiales bacterium]|nr:hypothetical protein BOSEA31B_11223 [Hyphomicrobiales bacterium]CAH1697015.1 hypothetical protein BOSEA1005_10052 [Hyphomicrobiales bacterium]CAI0344953.1 hypothetical protein BO1005MUT1_350320 [Hyphomicrobiales bacterium]